jgi:hypothetical protein
MKRLEHFALPFATELERALYLMNENLCVERARLAHELSQQVDADIMSWLENDDKGVKATNVISVDFKRRKKIE